MVKLGTANPMDFATFAFKLAQVESANNPDAKLGDGGRALGRWQTHPDRLCDEAHHYGITPHLGETWDSLVRRVLDALFVARTQQGHSPITIAMYWHVGHFTLPGDGDWDAEYATRFDAA